ncbi:hypothetical protein ElyMa_005956800 [Elysia marginata]|uniref:Uncharacterized protein n=1 Tax=Elysia marginata TaxID=1093978 RepID=A0AAV4GAG5_9GAST|nr:hypothetical protein ElyMa_005956800 [Elysia marginata]
MTVGNAVLEQVSKYSYLGHMITEDVATLKEVQIRIEKTRQKFSENKELLRRNVGRNTKKIILACYIFQDGSKEDTGVPNVVLQETSQGPMERKKKQQKNCTNG